MDGASSATVGAGGKANNTAEGSEVTPASSTTAPSANLIPSSNALEDNKAAAPRPTKKARITYDAKDALYCYFDAAKWPRDRALTKKNTDAELDGVMKMFGLDPSQVSRQLRNWKARSYPFEAGASCWICFEEGIDAYSAALERDFCSCRGSAGIAHLSCLVDYAQQKTLDTELGVIETYEEAMKLREPWEVCPCCKQPYRGSVGYTMAAECLDFFEAHCPQSPSWLLEGKLLKVRSGCLLLLCTFGFVD